MGLELVARVLRIRLLTVGSLIFASQQYYPDEPETSVKLPVGAPLVGAPHPQMPNRDRSLRSPNVDAPANDDDAGLAP